MNKAEYARMAKFEGVYWWHQGRLFLLNELISKYFKDKKNLNLLEVGCGTGETSQYLEKFGKVTGLDISEDAIEFCKERGLKNLVLGDINSVDLEALSGGAKFDIVFALDVMEHIQDDVKAMKRIKSLLSEDGIFITTVPAHKFLWSEHDESLNHKRRYHSVEITQKLKDAGFDILKRSYFITLLSPIIVLYRAYNNFFRKHVYPTSSYVETSEWANKFMLNVLKIEAKLIKNLNLPFGITIVTVAK